ncbi:MAG: hypothetical protein HKM87_04700 [Ignavibacteriaceae bacterium]|nr:hypothetical protein [Ignavibacteriaceae bacterium]
MKKILTLILCALFFVILSSNTLGQELTTAYNTGDADMDSHLVEINESASSDYEAFKDKLSENSEITDEEIDRYINEENMEPADVYYASVLSSASDRPVSEVMGMYKEKKGWGAVAQELGIKPGSEEFHELKANTVKKIKKDKEKKNKGDKHKKKSKNKK